MNIICDCPGSERSHGYTDDGDWVWYWVYDHGDDEVSFRKTGTPSGHPIRLGKVDEDVRSATEEWVQRRLDAPGVGVR